MRGPTSIVELRRRTSHGIYAISFQSRRPRAPQSLPDGAIVEIPTPDQRADAPDRPAACFEVAIDGSPATIHHINLGLVGGFLQFDGFYVLSGGEVAAVYGAHAVPVCEPARPEGSQIVE